MTRLVQGLFVLAITCSLTGCGGAPVSESSARTAFEKSTKEISDGKAKLNSFHKTNAQSGEMLGVKFYSVEYEAEIQFLEDVPKPKPFRIGIMRGNKTEFPAEKQTEFLHKKGDTKKMTGSLNFEKTEKGWRGPDKNIY